MGHLDDGRGRYPEHRHALGCPAGGNRAAVTHLKQKLAEAEAPKGSREW